MNTIEAQEDMRNAYTGGSTGVLASGFIWLIAGIVALFSTEFVSILTFFFGGMLIHPLGLLLDKALKQSGKHDPQNPLAKWAILSTFLIFIGLYVAYTFYHTKSSHFYPVMMIAIGIRYLIFQYLYGMKIYWLLGSTLIIFGITTLSYINLFYVGALLGGLIEIVYAYFIFKQIKPLGILQ